MGSTSGTTEAESSIGPTTTPTDTGRGGGWSTRGKPIDSPDQEQAAALQLYRLAAEQGIAGAQCRLGVMYAEGRGVDQDDHESVRWFRLAAEQGDAEAQGGLGLAYATGRGIAQDFVAAHVWMTLAAGRLTGETRSGALRFRATIEATMTSAQIAEARRLAAAWTPRSTA